MLARELAAHGWQVYEKWFAAPVLTSRFIFYQVPDAARASPCPKPASNALFRIYYHLKGLNAIFLLGNCPLRTDGDAYSAVATSSTR
jgi:hypothetical protein